MVYITANTKICFQSLNSQAKSAITCAMNKSILSHMPTIDTDSFVHIPILCAGMCSKDARGSYTRGPRLERVLVTLHPYFSGFNLATCFNLQGFTS